MDAEWVNSVIKRVEDSRLHTQWGTEAPTIYRVPQSVRSGNPSAYEPTIVSIGPYHRSKPQLTPMEELKWQFLDHHLSATPDNDIVDYLGMMKELEAETRCHYSEEIKLGSNDFVEMMLLDGCFLVQIFLPQHLRPGMPEQQLRKTMWFHNFLIHDLLMLENQLPFFILQRLLDALRIPRRGNFSFKKAALLYLGNILLGEMENLPQNLDLDNLLVHHFLHLFHSWFFPRKPDVTTSCCGYPLDQVKKIKNQLVSLLMPETRDFDHSNPVLKSIPCATKLKEAGVKFKAKNIAKFLDISFHKGVLEIPTIHVDDSINCIFQNLIALEQCCPEFGTFFTAYSLFMDSIINSPSDVALLQQEGIIETGLGDHREVAFHFNRISRNICYDPINNYLAQTIIDVNDYCESRWHKWRARLVREYFSNPWTITSLGAAAVLLGLTLTQTVFSILSYSRGK